MKRTISSLVTACFIILMCLKSRCQILSLLLTKFVHSNYQLIVSYKSKHLLFLNIKKSLYFGSIFASYIFAKNLQINIGLKKVLSRRLLS